MAKSRGLKKNRKSPRYTAAEAKAMHKKKGGVKKHRHSEKKKHSSHKHKHGHKKHHSSHKHRHGHKRRTLKGAKRVTLYLK
jgi:hypothetical protein